VLLIDDLETFVGASLRALLRMSAAISALALPFLALSRRQRGLADTVDVAGVQPAAEPA
jgi:hypothetical protein